MAKRGASFLKVPPSFQKPLICCFAPQGNPCSGTYSAPKNQGKMPQGTTILSVKPRPGKCPSEGEAGKTDIRPCIREKRRPVSPTHHDRPACGACPDLPPPHDKGRPSASSLMPSGLRPATIKKRPPLRAASDERVWEKAGGPPPASIFPRYRRFPARGCCRLRSWPSVPACA